MLIRIYQMNLERDKNRVAFLNYATMKKRQTEFDFSPYDIAYAGKVDCGCLEDVFTVFNLYFPANYNGRSLSVSDIVEVIESDVVEKGFYFCDDFGFLKLPCLFKDEMPPDSSVTLSDMYDYGYCYAQMLPLNRESALELWDKGYCVYLLYEDNTEGEAMGKKDIIEHIGLFGIEKSDWLSECH